MQARKKLVVLDCPFLCHRAYHTSGELSWKGKATGVLFGFFTSLMALHRQFPGARFAFCFEHPHLFRSEVFAEYKQRRRKRRTPEEQRAYETVIHQISELQRRYLPKLGYANVFSVRGYESDDLLACLADKVRCFRGIVLVTADKDLYQCLRPGVVLHDPIRQVFRSYAWFKNTYGFSPRFWPVVKALAGCSSDSVPGIPQIGEKTACKYVRDELGKQSLAYSRICSPVGVRTYRRNWALVRLPYNADLSLTLRDDALSEDGWREVCGLLGMRSLRMKPPWSYGQRQSIRA